MPNMPDVIILCGGAGLRLRSVTGDSPKGMAQVAGRPFLELLLRQLRRQDFERAILAVGYQQDVIRAYFGGEALGLRLEYSSESSPLGTGGALRNAAHLVESEIALIMNGDSYTEVKLGTVLADYRESNADACLVVVPADGRHDVGSVFVDEAGRVVGFDEKPEAPRAPYASAGIYVIQRQMLLEVPFGCEVSLEKEIFPRWLGEGKHIKGIVCHARCTDIGTPERYRRAQDVLATAEVELATPECESHP
jgi:mannose-1-phosphate guanylyltransferase